MISTYLGDLKLGFHNLSVSLKDGLLNFQSAFYIPDQKSASQ